MSPFGALQFVQRIENTINQVINPSPSCLCFLSAVCVEDIPSSRVIVDVKLGAKRGFCNPAESIFVSVLDVSKAYLQKIIAIHISVIFFFL